MSPIESPVIVTFANGVGRLVAADLAPRVRGLDVDGDLVVADPHIVGPGGDEYLYPLTPCHDASGKGSADSSTHVVCRACHREVAAKFGGTATVAIPVASTPPIPAVPTKCTPEAIADQLGGPLLAVLTPDRARLLVEALETHAETLTRIGGRRQRDDGIFVDFAEEADDLYVLARAFRLANAKRGI